MTDVAQWLESNFEFLHSFSDHALLRFARRFGDFDSSIAAAKYQPEANNQPAANNQPESVDSSPEAKLDKHIGEMLGTLKSSVYLEGNLDNYCGSSPDFGALIEAHHGTSYVRGSVSAPSSDLVPLGNKDDLGSGLGSVSAGAFILDGGNGDSTHRPDEEFIFPLGALPPEDLGPPPVI